MPQWRYLRSPPRTTPSLLHQIDLELTSFPAGRCRTSALIIDLGGVSSFEHGGLKIMRHARHQAAARGVGFCLTGCSERLRLLPLRAAQLLEEFPWFPTVEVALIAQTSREPVRRPAPRPSPSGPDRSRGRVDTADG
ncbi:STAS domain-containing protein [Pseudonocardia alni]|uniref:STAS domain-containing protein n=1 Tax=Pseudonocardia alni TaxID=33907 RepID=UPI0033705C08